LKKLLLALFANFTTSALDAGLLGIGAIALLVSSFSNAAAPTLFRAIIDNSTRAFVGRDGSTMAKSERQMLMKALAVFAVGAVGSWLRTRCFGIVSARVGKRIRRRLFRVILDQVPICL
jgi:ABC-type multidrug transport system fused ATPase/permease subunit